MNTKIIIFILLLIISVSTLILAFVSGSNRELFSILTIVSHMALVGFGYFYAKSKHEAFLVSLKKDLGF